MALMLMEFSAALGETFRQDGRRAYAYDRVIINLIHETGTAPAGTNSTPCRYVGPPAA